MSLNSSQFGFVFGARLASSSLSALPTTRWWLRRLQGGVLDRTRRRTLLRGMPAGRGAVDWCRMQLCCAVLSQGLLLFGRDHCQERFGRLEFRLGSCLPYTSRSRSRSKDTASQTNFSDGRPVSKTVQAFGIWTWPGSTRTLMDRRTRRERKQDDGDWRYSPEWWGTQGGGWGHNKGEAVFETASTVGNGVVSVTAHPASTPRRRQEEAGDLGEGFGNESSYNVLGYEWRVLRFNEVTRQSVAKVKALSTRSGDLVLLQQPDCIAFEFIKSMISVGLAAVSLCGLDLQSVQQRHQKMRILCVGLGGGSLPLFLAHRLPGATVDVVEIDRAVIAAAVESMGFPPSHAPMSSNAAVSATKDEALLWGSILERITVHERDAESFVHDQLMKAATQNIEPSKYDLVCVDAFDGNDVVPWTLLDRNGSFLRDLSALLSDEHGAVVVNLHTDSAPPNVFERVSGKFGPGFDPTLPQGRRVQEAALAYRDVLVHKSGGNWPTENDHADTRMEGSGFAFTVGVSFQGNITLATCRGSLPSGAGFDDLPDYTPATEDSITQKLMSEAERVQDSLRIPFEMSRRVSRGFHIVR